MGCHLLLKYNRLLLSNIKEKVLIYTFEYISKIIILRGFLGGSVVKNLPAKARDTG